MDELRRIAEWILEHASDPVEEITWLLENHKDGFESIRETYKTILGESK